MLTRGTKKSIETYEIGFAVVFFYLVDPFRHLEVLIFVCVLRYYATGVLIDNGIESVVELKN